MIEECDCDRPAVRGHRSDDEGPDEDARDDRRRADPPCIQHVFGTVTAAGRNQAQVARARAGDPVEGVDDTLIAF